MQTSKAEFTNLMAEIVSTEMNEEEQGIFEIEGQEWIDQLLEDATINSELDDAAIRKLQMGIAADPIEIIKVACSCGALIVSSLTLYLNFIKDKGSRLKGDVERLEAMKKLKDLMINEGMPPTLVEVVNQKYAQRIIDVLDRF